MSIIPLYLLISLSVATVINFEDAGATRDDNSWDTVWANGAIMNKSLAQLMPGDTLVVPNATFYIMGGLMVQGLKNATIQLDGTLAFASTTLNAEKYIKQWPRDANGRVKECFYFIDAKHITFTSSGKGTLDGKGAKWWGVPGIGYLLREENRPRLIKIENSEDVVFEHWFLKDSPYWNFLASHVDGLVIRYSSIDARRTNNDGHDVIDLTAFNTDGFDVTGRNIHIHDCTVWNQDDCFDVKDSTENVLIERIEASGLGLTIGSISSTVRNITFRDAHMHNTYKGIYMKFRGPGLIADVLFENIVIDNAEQWGIWIGPAQQSDSKDLCAAHPCSLCWPDLPGAECNSPAGGQYTNITLRNVTLNSPKQSPGVLLANETSPMKNVVFEDVVVNNPGAKPWGDDFYKCEHVQGVATGKTFPVPPCFADRTDATLAKLAAQEEE